MTIAAGAQGEATAFCPAGETALAGGFGLVGPDAGIVLSFGNGSAWVAKAENAGGVGVEPAQLTAYAYCSPGVSFVP